jgi:polyisoprenoid-binding protein YceI
MKRLLVLLSLAVVIIAGVIGSVVAIQLMRDDDPDLLTSAPAIPTPNATSASGTVVATTGTTPTPATGSTPTTTSTPSTALTPSSASTPSSSSTPVATATTAPTAANVLHFTIDSGSSAKYVVREKLAQLPVSTDAVGSTTDITGDIYLSPNGLATGPTSSFKVDLRTLRTDEALRDRFVRDQTLETGRFPFAEFVITSITPFPTNYVDGTEATLNITGTMVIHGVTKPMTFTSKARRAGGSLTAIADVDFKMSDFNITPPDVRLAKSEDGVHLQVVVVAKLVAN